MDIKKFNKKDFWDYENAFHWFSPPNRISKQIAQWELFKQSCNVDGDILEIGVFKATSLIRWATFREMCDISFKRIYGFDAFGSFPINNSASTEDKQFVQKFSSDGGDGLSKDQIDKIMQNKNFKNYNLVKGDIALTLPNFLNDNPNLKISFLHLDVDIYDPTILALNLLWDRISKGGLLVIDDYKSVKGATDAVDEFLEKKIIKEKINQSKFNISPFYFVKL